MWPARHEAQVTVEGTADADLAARLDGALVAVVRAGATHVVVDLHRAVGDERAVLEVVAGACRRLWRRRGVMELHGLRHHRAGDARVQALPEIVGALSGPSW